MGASSTADSCWGTTYRNTPSDYFGPGSGYGRLFAALDERIPAPRRVGIIGLGAGVVASYGRPGDTFTFYEISPRVVEVAHSEFTFLRDTAGDRPTSCSAMAACRSSARRRRGYDVLGIDAFAGDSIPMHLVTREAMALYVRHLAPDGVIVFQATNRYIDLLPVVKRLANEVGMEAVLVSDVPAGSDTGPDYWLSSTDQILVTRNRRLLESDALRYVATPIARPRRPGHVHRRASQHVPDPQVDDDRYRSHCCVRASTPRSRRPIRCACWRHSCRHNRRARSSSVPARRRRAWRSRSSAPGRTSSSTAS